MKLKLLNIKKSVAVLTTACFLFTMVFSQGAYAIAMPTQLPVVNQNALKSIENYLLPFNIGRITDALYTGGDEVVINIQDLHSHAQAQRNISSILSALDNKYGLENVYVEGGIGQVDTSWLSSISNKELREKILNNMLESGRLTGGEYYSVETNKNKLLKGIEDKDTYISNLKRLDEFYSKKQDILKYVSFLKYTLNNVSKKYYTRDNLKLNRVVSKHEAGNLSAQKYFTYLLETANKANINLKKYPNIIVFLQVLKKQEGLDTKKVNLAIAELLNELKTKLSYEQYQALISKVSNKSKETEFYFDLYKVAKERGLLEKSDYRTLLVFFEYLSLNQSLNPVNLTLDEKNLLQELNIKLSKSQNERDIYFLQNYLGYFSGYLTNKLTASDYEYFINNMARFRLLWEKYVDIDGIIELDSYFGFFGDFYKDNVERNRYFIKNVIGKMPNEPKEGLRIKSNINHAQNVLDQLSKSKKVKVVITGGFHTYGFTKLLQDNNVNYIVITPNVTKQTVNADVLFEDVFKEQSSALYNTLQKMLVSQLGGIDSILNSDVLEALDSTKLTSQAISVLNKALADKGQGVKVVDLQFGKDDNNNNKVIAVLNNGTNKEIVLKPETEQTEKGETISVQFDKQNKADFETFDKIADLSKKIRELNRIISNSDNYAQKEEKLLELQNVVENLRKEIEKIDEKSSLKDYADQFKNMDKIFAKENIVLIGPSGSGKSTTAKLVAETAGAEIISFDKLIRDYLVDEKNLSENSEEYKTRHSNIKNGIYKDEKEKQEIINRLEEEIKDLGSAQKVFVDGFGRTVEQINILKDIFELKDAIFVYVERSGEDALEIGRQKQIEAGHADNSLPVEDERAHWSANPVLNKLQNDGDIEFVHITKDNIIPSSLIASFAVRYDDRKMVKEYGEDKITKEETEKLNKDIKLINKFLDNQNGLTSDEEAYFQKEVSKAQSIVKFGTAGHRELIINEDGIETFNPFVVFVLTDGYAEYINKKDELPKRMFVGYDTRYMGEKYTDIVSKTFSKYGITVDMPNTYLSTPAISNWVKNNSDGIKYAGSVNITASHNPGNYNGYKVNGPLGDPYGSIVTDEISEYAKDTDRFEMSAIKARIAQSKDGKVNKIDVDEFRTSHVDNAITIIKNMLGKKDVSLLPGTNVIFDANHSALELEVKRLFKELKSELKNILNSGRDVVFAKEGLDKGKSPEPNEKNSEQLRADLEKNVFDQLAKLKKSGKLTSEQIKQIELTNFAVTTDPDGDRFGMYYAEYNKDKGIFEVKFATPDEMGAVVQFILLESLIKNLKTAKETGILNETWLQENGFPVGLVKSADTTDQFNLLAESYKTEIKNILEGSGLSKEKIAKFSEIKIETVDIGYKNLADAAKTMVKKGINPVVLLESSGGLVAGLSDNTGTYDKDGLVANMLPIVLLQNTNVTFAEALEKIENVTGKIESLGRTKVKKETGGLRALSNEFEDKLSDKNKNGKSEGTYDNYNSKIKEENVPANDDASVVDAALMTIGNIIINKSAQGDYKDIELSGKPIKLEKIVSVKDLSEEDFETLQKDGVISKEVDYEKVENKIRELSKKEIFINSDTSIANGFEIRFYNKKGYSLIVRASGTEPAIRIYTKTLTLIDNKIEENETRQVKEILNDIKEYVGHNDISLQTLLENDRAYLRNEIELSENDTMVLDNSTTNLDPQLISLLNEYWKATRKDSELERDLNAREQILNTLLSKDNKDIQNVFDIASEINNGNYKKVVILTDDEYSSKSALETMYTQISKDAPEVEFLAATKENLSELRKDNNTYVVYQGSDKNFIDSNKVNKSISIDDNIKQDYIYPLLPIAVSCKDNSKNVVREFLEGERKILNNKNVIKQAVMVNELNYILGIDTCEVLPYSSHANSFVQFVQNMFSGFIKVFGQPGTDGQHSFYQSSHQGTFIVYSIFIGFANSSNRVMSDSKLRESHLNLLSNLLAQAYGFAVGRNKAEVKKQEPKLAEDLVSHKVFKGNRPSTVLLFSNPNAVAAGASHSLFSIVGKYNKTIKEDKYLQNLRNDLNEEKSSDMKEIFYDTRMASLKKRIKNTTNEEEKVKLNKELKDLENKENEIKTINKDINKEKATALKESATVNKKINVSENSNINFKTNLSKTIIESFAKLFFALGLNEKLLDIIGRTNANGDIVVDNKANFTENRYVTHYSRGSFIEIKNGKAIATRKFLVKIDSEFNEETYGQRYNRDGSPNLNGEYVDIAPKEVEVINKMIELRNGYENKGIKHFISFGIGGSDLGPRKFTEILEKYKIDKSKAHFVHNVDPEDFISAIEEYNEKYPEDKITPENTLFIIESKSFTTAETMTNAGLAKEWFNANKKKETTIGDHFVAVSTNKKDVGEFGIDTENNMFPFQSSIGGRFSVMSPVGLPLMLSIGAENYIDMLEGQAEIYNSVRKDLENGNLADNPAFMTAVANIFNINVLHKPHQIIKSAIKGFVDYFQQLYMECNGKSVDRNGNDITTYDTGNNVMEDDNENPEGIISIGKSENKFEKDTATAIFELNELSPSNLGALTALHEFKTIIAGLFWNINSFDQWGVELGKKLAITNFDIFKKAVKEGISAITSSDAIHKTTKNLMSFIFAEQENEIQNAQLNLGVGKWAPIIESPLFFIASFFPMFRGTLAKMHKYNWSNYTIGDILSAFLNRNINAPQKLNIGDSKEINRGVNVVGNLTVLSAIAIVIMSVAPMLFGAGDVAAHNLINYGILQPEFSLIDTGLKTFIGSYIVNIITHKVWNSLMDLLSMPQNQLNLFGSDQSKYFLNNLKDDLASREHDNLTLSIFIQGKINVEENKMNSADNVYDYLESYVMLAIWNRIKFGNITSQTVMEDAVIKELVSLKASLRNKTYLKNIKIDNDKLTSALKEYIESIKDTKIYSSEKVKEIRENVEQYSIIDFYMEKINETYVEINKKLEINKKQGKDINYDNFSRYGLPKAQLEVFYDNLWDFVDKSKKNADYNDILSLIEILNDLKFKQLKVDSTTGIDNIGVNSDGQNELEKALNEIIKIKIKERISQLDKDIIKNDKDELKKERKLLGIELNKIEIKLYTLENPDAEGTKELIKYLAILKEILPNNILPMYDALGKDVEESTMLVSELNKVVVTDGFFEYNFAIAERNGMKTKYIFDYNWDTATLSEDFDINDSKLPDNIKRDINNLKTIMTLSGLSGHVEESGFLGVGEAIRIYEDAQTDIEREYAYRALENMYEYFNSNQFKERLEKQLKDLKIKSSGNETIIREILLKNEALLNVIKNETALENIDDIINALINNINVQQKILSYDDGNREPEKTLAFKEQSTAYKALSDIILPLCVENVIKNSLEEDANAMLNMFFDIRYTYTNDEINEYKNIINSYPKKDKISFINRQIQLYEKYEKEKIEEGKVKIGKRGDGVYDFLQTTKNNLQSTKLTKDSTKNIRIIKGLDNYIENENNNESLRGIASLIRELLVGFIEIPSFINEIPNIISDYKFLIASSIKSVEYYDGEDAENYFNDPLLMSHSEYAQRYNDIYVKGNNRDNAKTPEAISKYWSDIEFMKDMKKSVRRINLVSFGFTAVTVIASMSWAGLDASVLTNLIRFIVVPIVVFILANAGSHGLHNLLNPFNRKLTKDISTEDGTETFNRVKELVDIYNDETKTYVEREASRRELYDIKGIVDDKDIEKKISQFAIDGFDINKKDLILYLNINTSGKITLKSVDEDVKNSIDEFSNKLKNKIEQCYSDKDLKQKSGYEDYKQFVEKTLIPIYIESITGSRILNYVGNKQIIARNLKVEQYYDSVVNKVKNLNKKENASISDEELMAMLKIVDRGIVKIEKKKLENGVVVPGSKRRDPIFRKDTLMEAKNEIRQKIFKQILLDEMRDKELRERIEGAKNQEELDEILVDIAQTDQETAEKIISRIDVKKTLADIDGEELEGKTIGLVLDLNVPIMNGKITDYTRIDATLKTIKYLTDRGAKVVAMSHHGRPKGWESEESLEIVAKGIEDRAKENLNYDLKVKFPKVSLKEQTYSNYLNSDVMKNAVQGMNNGDILLLENLRFDDRYSSDNKADMADQFVDKLGLDGVVFDAFGVSHRNNFIRDMITKVNTKEIGALTGFLVEKELSEFAKVETPKHPFVAILGGSKVSDKIGVIENLLDKMTKGDTIVIGGAMAYTFLKAQGHEIGSSLVEDDRLELANSLQAAADKKGVRLLLPVDHVVASGLDFENEANNKAEPNSDINIPKDKMGVDIGPKTVEEIKEVLEKVGKEDGTIVWNGPSGVFEIPAFAKGTFAVAKAVAEATDNGAFSMIGGGDSVAAANQAGVSERISHISTGGGASLNLLEGNVSPLIEVIPSKFQREIDILKNNLGKKEEYKVFKQILLDEIRDKELRERIEGAKNQEELDEILVDIAQTDQETAEKIISRIDVKKTLADIDGEELEGKTIGLVLDLNVPIMNGKITDYTRIDATLKTIKYLTDRGAKVVAMSHHGRPKGWESEESLEIVAKGIEDRAKENLNYDLKVKFPKVSLKEQTYSNYLNSDVMKDAVQGMNNGDVLLLENLRFDDRYSSDNKSDMAEQFVDKLGLDGVVFDAFGVSHRNNFIRDMITKVNTKEIGALTGFLVEKELSEFAKVETPKHPFVAILGGSKVSDKIGVIENLLDKMTAGDTIVIGGAMAYTFLKAQGHEIGSSLVEDDRLELANSLQAAADKKGVRLLLPVDHVVASGLDFENEANNKAEPNSDINIPKDKMGVDIGPKTVEEIKEVLEKVGKEDGTIVWNGPSGVFEIPAFAKGTFAVAKAVAEATDNGAFSMIGGGDSVAAANQAGVSERISHISTGGGASLNLLEGNVSPLIEVIPSKFQKEIDILKNNLNKQEQSIVATAAKKSDAFNLYDDSFTQEQKREFEEDGLASVRNGETVIAIPAAGDSSRMQAKQAGEHIEGLEGKQVLSKGGVPISADGDTFLGFKVENAVKFLKEIEEQAIKQNLDTSKIKNNTIMIMTTSVYYEEQQEIVNKVLEKYDYKNKVNIVFFNQDKGSVNYATVDDVRKMKDKYDDEDEYYAALYKAYIDGGNEAEKAPLGHGEFWHQAIGKGVIAGLPKTNRYMFVSNVDNVAALSNDIMLQEIGLLKSEGVGALMEVSPNAPGLAGGGFIKETIDGKDYYRQYEFQANPDVKKSEVFNDAVGVFDLNAVREVYESGVKEDATLEEIADNGKGKFKTYPAIKQRKEKEKFKIEESKIKEKKNEDKKDEDKLTDEELKRILELKSKGEIEVTTCVVKTESSLWGISCVPEFRAAVTLVGNGSKIDSLIKEGKDYSKLSDEERKEILKEIRFLGTKQWELSDYALENLKNELNEILPADEQIESTNDMRVLLRAETYSGNKQIINDYIEYVRSGDLVSTDNSYEKSTPISAATAQTMEIIKSANEWLQIKVLNIISLFKEKAEIVAVVDVSDRDAIKTIREAKQLAKRGIKVQLAFVGSYYNVSQVIKREFSGNNVPTDESDNISMDENGNLYFELKNNDIPNLEIVFDEAVSKNIMSNQLGSTLDKLGNYVNDKKVLYVSDSIKGNIKDYENAGILAYSSTSITTAIAKGLVTYKEKYDETKNQFKDTFVAPSSIIASFNVDDTISDIDISNLAEQRISRIMIKTTKENIETAENKKQALIKKDGITNVIIVIDNEDGTYDIEGEDDSVISYSKALSGENLQNSIVYVGSQEKDNIVLNAKDMEKLIAAEGVTLAFDADVLNAMDSESTKENGLSMLGIIKSMFTNDSPEANKNKGITKGRNIVIENKISNLKVEDFIEGGKAVITDKQLQDLKIEAKTAEEKEGIALGIIQALELKKVYEAERLNINKERADAANELLTMLGEYRLLAKKSYADNNKDEIVIEGNNDYNEILSDLRSKLKSNEGDRSAILEQIIKILLTDQLELEANIEELTDIDIRVTQALLAAA